jgi:GNAT superfamily N-acetyltransferase
MITYTLYTGSTAEPYIKELGTWRLKYFKAFPYLYEGTIENEVNYGQTYTHNDQAFILIVKYKEDIIAISTGIPLEAPSMQKVSTLFQKDGFTPASVFYFGELIVSPEYRGKKIASKIIRMQESYAKTSGFSTACFMTVQREKDHPLRPQNYQTPEGRWKHWGYQKTNIEAEFEYNTLTSPEAAKPQKNKMSFWTKRLL